jgi:hypothetical protein
VFAVVFLTRLYVADAVAALLNVSDLRSSVFRCAVKQRNRNHRRKIVGQPAGKKQIEAAVLVAAGCVHVSGRMPGIDRRCAINGWLIA